MLRGLAYTIRILINNKLRSFFIIISTALGIGAITTIVAVTEGAFSEAEKVVSRFGPDAVLIESGGEVERAMGFREKTLTFDDLHAIENAFPTLYSSLPLSSTSGTIKYKNKNHSTRIFGGGKDYALSWNWPIEFGIDISEEHVNSSQNVALIGKFAAQKLFENENPVGKHIFINSIPFEIIGLLSERGISPRGMNLDDRVVIPISTLMKKFLNERKYLTAIRLKFTDKHQLDDRVEELRLFLRERKGLAPDQPDNFRILTAAEVIKFLVALTGSLVVFLGITGLITITIAGFVLANLFMLSISERKREIGIRRAVGAKKIHIIIQILTEAIILTSIGGILGFFLSYYASFFMTNIVKFKIIFSLKVFLFSLTIATIVGIIFGLQPAIRASNINPIEAIK